MSHTHSTRAEQADTQRRQLVASVLLLTVGIVLFGCTLDSLSSGALADEPWTVEDGETVSNVTLGPGESVRYRIDPAPDSAVNVTLDGNWSGDTYPVVEIRGGEDSILRLRHNRTVFHSGDGAPRTVRVEAPAETGVQFSLTLDTALVSDDDAEPDDGRANATNITPGTVVENRRLVLDDTDSYSLRLQEGDRLTVTAQTRADAPLELLVADESDGVVVTSLLDDVTNTTVRLAADTTGRYNIALSFTDSYAGHVADYTLSTQVTDALPNDAFEPNDWGPALLDAGQTITARVVADERDNYAVNASAGERVTYEVRSDTPALYARSNPGTLTRSNFTVSTVERSAGQAWLSLKSQNGVTANYSVSVETEQALRNDDAEPNDDRANATPIARNATIEDVRILGTDTDYYAVDLRAGERFFAQFAGMSTYVTPTLSLVRSDGTVLDADRYGQGVNRTVVATVNRTGTYFLRVAGTQTANYSVQTHVDTSPPTNHGLANATPLEPGETLTDRLLGANRADYYRLSLPGTTRLTAERAFTDPEFDTGVELLDGEGQPVFPSNPLEYGENVTVAEGGTYYLRVSGGSTPYRLSVSATDLTLADETEPNDSPDTAIPLDANATRSGLAIFGSDADYFTVTVPPGAQLTVTRDNLVPSTVAHDDTYESLVDVSMTTAGGEAIDLVSDENGRAVAPPNHRREPTTYVIRASVDSDVATNYTISTALEPGQRNDARWPNDDPATATPIAAGETIPDLRLVGAERDVFAVNLSYRQRLDVELLPERPPSEGVAVDVLSPDGNRVEEGAQTADGRRVVEYVPPSNGTYYVEVTSPSDALNLGYTLSVDTMPVGANTTVSIVSEPAQSLDTDPLLEDIDGDGQGTIFDVLAYYDHRSSDAIADNPTYFDFDGDGKAGTIFDALALYDEIR